jgi:hypothetical protein
MGGNNTNFGTGPTALADHGFTARESLKVGIHTYVAEAIPGTPVNLARWSVSRVVTDGSAAEGTTKWASGTSEFVHKADDMANLTYP